MRVMVGAGEYVNEKGTLLQRDEDAGTGIVVIDGATEGTVLPLDILASLDATEDDEDAGTLEWQARRQDGDCSVCFGGLEIHRTDAGPTIIAEVDNGWAVHPECVTP